MSTGCTYPTLAGRFHTIIAALLIGLTCTIAQGQVSPDSGAVTGIIKDQSGAVVPNATVTLTAPTGLPTQKSSAKDGSFTFPLLAAGTYTVTIEAAGFNKEVVNNVKVDVTQITDASVTLEVGQTTSEVSVNAQATQVNTTNSTLGDVLPGGIVDALPLSTRNFTNLLALNANASSSLPNASAAGRGSSTVFVDGQRGTNNNLVINGIDANNLGNNNFGSVPIPAPDTIEEFRVQTSLYDASSGKTSGGNINVLTKGGTNQYHGQLFEFFRNEDLNANDWFFNKSGTPRALLRQNQFGGDFGGPVPKMGQTFFFGSYQGTYQTNGLSGAINSQMWVLPAVRSRANIESAFGLAPGSLDPVSLAMLNLKGQYGGYLIPTRCRRRARPTWKHQRVRASEVQRGSIQFERRSQLRRQGAALIALFPCQCGYRQSARGTRRRKLRQR